MACLAKLWESDADQSKADQLFTWTNHSLEEGKPKAAEITADVAIKILDHIEERLGESFVRDMCRLEKLVWLSEQFSSTGNKSLISKYYNQASLLLEKVRTKAKLAGNNFDKDQLADLTTRLAEVQAALDTKKYIDCLEQIRELELQRNNYQKVLDVSQTKLAVLRDGNGKTDNFAYLNEIEKTCTLLQSIRMREEAHKILRQEMENGTSDHVLSGNLHVLEGKNYLFEKKNVEAKKSFEAALTCFHAGKTRDCEIGNAKAYQGLAVAAVQEGRLTDATNYYNKAEKILLEACGQNHREYGDLLLGKADLKLKQNRGNDISKEITQATAIFNNWQGDDKEIESLIQEAQLLSEIAYFGAAEDCLRIAKDHALAKRKKDRSLYMVLTLLGQTCLDNNKTKEGLEYLNQAQLLK